MDRLDAIKIFVRVVESGSFSAVARELGVGQPAVSKQVASVTGDCDKTDSLKERRTRFRSADRMRKALRQTASE